MTQAGGWWSNSTSESLRVNAGTGATRPDNDGRLDKWRKAIFELHPSEGIEKWYSQSQVD